MLAALHRSIARLGATALGAVDFARLLLRVGAGAVRGVVVGRREPGEVTSQMFEIGNRSLLFVAVTLGFIGMVLVFQTCLQVKRVVGDLSAIGGEFIKILVHEFGPTLTAMMLATRVGAGIAAEVGSMTVTEQTDALRMCGVDPVEYLIVPRLLAAQVMTLVLAILAVVVAVAAGTLTAYLQFNVNPNLFLDVSRVTSGDVIVGVSKCFAYGTAIPIVAGSCGLAARGGSEGVGWATTQAVIGSSFAVIILDLVLSAVGLFVFQGHA